jgi:hypothetical protein
LIEGDDFRCWHSLDGLGMALARNERQVLDRRFDPCPILDFSEMF